MAENPKETTSMLTAASALTSLGVESHGSNASQDNAAGERKGRPADDGSDSRDAKRRRTEEKESKSISAAEEEEVPMTFPQRLMEVLADEENSDVISWLPHGRGFMIYQKRKFATEIMPKYFKNSKFTSFTRKLNRWGFNRASRGPEVGAYFHPYFQKGNLRLCLQMTCHAARPTLAQQRTSLMAASPFCVNNAMGGLSLNQNQLLMSQAPRGTVNNHTTSLLRLRQLQEQQEQLLMQQQQIKQQMEAFAKTLPQKIVGRQSAESMPGTDGSLATDTIQPQMQASQPQITSLNSQQRSFPMHNMPNTSTIAPGMSRDPAHSQAIINAAVEALQRSNTNQYIAMLMAQGKVHSTGPPSTANPIDFQQQLRQAIQAQLEEIKRCKHQRAASTSAAMNQQGQVTQMKSTEQVPPAKLQHQQSPIRREAGPSQRKGARRASAA